LFIRQGYLGISNYEKKEIEAQREVLFQNILKLLSVPDVSVEFVCLRLFVRINLIISLNLCRRCRCSSFCYMGDEELMKPNGPPNLELSQRPSSTQLNPTDFWLITRLISTAWLESYILFMPSRYLHLTNWKVVWKELFKFRLCWISNQFSKWASHNSCLNS